MIGKTFSWFHESGSPTFIAVVTQPTRRRTRHRRDRRLNEPPVRSVVGLGSRGSPIDLKIDSDLNKTRPCDCLNKSGERSSQIALSADGTLGHYGDSLTASKSQIQTCVSCILFAPSNP